MTAILKRYNFATSTIANVGGISDSDLSVDVQAGDGALFDPDGDIDGSSYYIYAVMIDSSGNREIVKVTNVSSDTLTIARAQQGTSARAFAADDKIELRVTAGDLEEWPNTPEFSDNDTGLTINNVMTERLDLDLGSVLVGDVFILSGHIRGTKGGTAGEVIVNLAKKSGTATISMINAGSPNIYAYILNADEAQVPITVPVVVTGAGTLVMKLQAQSNGSDLSSGYAYLHAVFVKKV